MTWREQLRWLLSWLLPKRYPLPTLDVTAFEEQAVRRAKQHHRWCEICKIGFRTTPEFHDHNVFTHYGSWGSAGSRRRS